MCDVPVSTPNIDSGRPRAQYLVTIIFVVEKIFILGPVTVVQRVVVLTRLDSVDHEQRVHRFVSLIVLQGTLVLMKPSQN